MSDEDILNSTLVRTAPERIYLQVGDDPDGYDMEWPAESAINGDVTWCSCPATSVEVPYVRADLLVEAEAEIGRLDAALSAAVRHKKGQHP